MSTKRAFSLQRGLAQAGAGRSEFHTLIGRGTGRDTHALSGGEGMGSLNLTSPCSLLPVHSLHCELTAHRTLLLRTLGPMGDQVLFHDLLSEAQDLRLLGIDDGPHPMRIRVAKGLYPREVLNGAAAGGAEQRFINAKNVRIAVHVDHRLSETHRLPLHSR